MPMVEKALKALDTLEPKDIGEMRGYAKPPVDLVELMKAVMYIMDVKGEWPEAQGLMKDPNGFVLSLKKFDKDNIKEKKLKGLKAFVKDPRLEPDTIAKKSLAGKSIAMWVHAIDKYAEVKKIIVPKEIAMNEAKAQLAVVEKELKTK